MLKGNNRIIVTAVIGVILLVGANFIFNSDDGFISSSNSMDGPKAVIETDFGYIVIQLYADAAPGHVDNFVQLAGQGYYDGTTFHRIIPGFMIQGGDPNSRDEDRRTHGMGGHSAKGPNTVVNAEPVLVWTTNISTVLVPPVEPTAIITSPTLSSLVAPRK